MTDLEIARSTELKRIDDVAASMGIGGDALEHYGKYVAKLPLSLLKGRKPGHLILVTAITATKAGIGKTTVSIGLALGLNHIGRRAVVALREPSLGPCFGMKGGAAGGGHAQVLPMERINLHFTGDFHAITSAHNMIAALLDNYQYQHAGDGFALKEVLWRRVLDVNDRSLRSIVTGLGPATNGLTQQSGFDITPASELMAILCLATDEADLRRMTFSQGKMLIKLVDRECDATSYDLIRVYRGKFSAFFWQGFAKIFGADLKAEYDTSDYETRVIERIITLVEAGML